MEALSKGRPPKPIDWDMIDRCIKAGCNATQIAPLFNLHYTYFLEKFKIHHGVTFLEYAHAMEENGKLGLMLKSYEKAIKGDNFNLGMQLKHRCGFKDGSESDNKNITVEIVDYSKKENDSETKDSPTS